VARMLDPRRARVSPSLDGTHAIGER
jgi:hypothetical protein